MAKNLKWITACLAGVLAPWLIATAPAAADEQFAVTRIVSLPDHQVLGAFDISFVAPESHVFAVASSYLHSVVVVDTRTNLVTKELQANPPFIGNCSIPPQRDAYSGPNGVMVIEKGRNADVWAGDGPVFNTHCVPASGVKTPSTLKVLDLHTGATKAVISTGGQRRADEMCFNPRSDVVLISNPDALDNFITFVAEDSFKVLQTMKFDGSDKSADNIVASGIEQCVFNPRDGKFYINIPATKKDGSGPGLVLRISEQAPFKVEKVFTVPASTGCGGGAGLAVGPDHQLALGCGGANALIMDDRDGSTIKVITGEGGADEIWYNPGDNHYFFARSGAMKLGVEDAGPPPSADPDAATATGSHSVAADPHRNQVYVPIRGNSATVPIPGTSKICSSATDHFGHKGDDGAGCIAVYTAPRDKDDRRAEDEHEDDR
jgi:hypothetical protein